MSVINLINETIDSYEKVPEESLLQSINIQLQNLGGLKDIVVAKALEKEKIEREKALKALKEKLEAQRKEREVLQEIEKLRLKESEEKEKLNKELQEVFNQSEVDEELQMALLEASNY